MAPPTIDERQARVWPAPADRSSTPEAGTEHRFLRDLILGMRCGVLSIDRHGRLTMLNEPALQILELDTAPPPGAPVELALRGHPQLARILRESFTMSSLPNRAEIDLRCRTDKGKTVGFTLSLVAGDDGEPYGAAIFFKDLTPVEQKEEQERIKDRLAALGQMAANMAHEIRNPLASIEVSCSLVKRRISGDDEAHALLDRILTEVRRLNGTIRSSLEYVRPLKLSPRVDELVPVLDEALRVATGRSGETGVRIERRYDPAVTPFLMDAAQLRQVFENLFLNALEAMEDGGVLTIETAVVPAPAAASVPYEPAGEPAGDPWRQFDAYAQVRVADTGPGIADEHLDKLFYPFFTTKKTGSGVGLPTARKIVDSHRGLLDVSVEPDRGAVFTVRLPLVNRVPEEESR